jgi:hypothetical protein
VSRSVDRLIFGDNPFLGVEHLDQARYRAKRPDLTKDRMRQTLNAAVSAGATALMFSTHAAMVPILREVSLGLRHNGFGYYPLFPYAAGYARMATERGFLGLAEGLQERLGAWQGLRAGASAGWGLLRSDPRRLLRALATIEVEPFVGIMGPDRVRAILLHEIMVDLSLGLDEPGLMRECLDFLRDRYGTRVGLATRNFALLVDRICRWDLDVDVVVAPLNLLGFQMAPSREACVEALDRLPGPIALIAVSVLAGGLLEPRQALEFIRDHPRIDAVALGTSKPDHAIETFHAAAEILRVDPH